MKVRILRGPVPVGLLYYRAGEQVDLPDAIASVLIKVGRVEKVGAESLKTRRVYRRTDAKPQETTVMVAEPAEHARRTKGPAAPKSHKKPE